ncbi:cell wall hydrolase [Virgibacillus soli]|uniref:Cell wall hydrolase n=1 Tax=Paracerasibacillus soli TaxID=480284 RepID=A0ABU5CNK8_9BACI|nr:cell wall hydrolase [Virgibacillus soli]MDY0407942.1 cell wall hydrolase [Virgibacillus soli]
MRKIKSFLITTALSLAVFTLPVGAQAASYTVKSGDSYWNIANKYGVSVKDLQNANNRSNATLYVGETLTIPNQVSSADKKLMAKLIHAEAKGESYAGKVAVATVILNRVDHKDFPNTVKGVIYEKSGGAYAFTPVQNGSINQDYNTEDMKAVNEAIAFRGQGSGSLYFYNPKTAKSTWILSRKVTVTIGNHRFAK